MTRLSIAVAVSAIVLTLPGAFAQRGRAMGQMGPQARPAPMPRAEGPGHSGPKSDVAHGPARPAKTAAVPQIKPALAQKLQPLLPAGMPLDTAAAGFKNRGQFIAALHVSQNLGIPFADLKAQMTGTQKQSLGKAIHTLRPDMPQKAVTDAERTAVAQAKQDERPEAQTAAR